MIGATSALGHAGYGVLAREHHRLQVDVEHTVPVVFVHLDNAAASQYSDIVEQDVKAPVLLDCGLHHGAAFLGTGDVAFERRRLSALLPDGRQGLFRLVQGPVHQQDPGPPRANSVAVALPVPTPGPLEPAPVTMATLPSSLNCGRCISPPSPDLAFQQLLDGSGEGKK